MTMGQYAARLERHIELFKDRERLERIRVGTAAAAIMSTGMATKQDGTPWMPWDVFSELQPMQEQETDPVAIRAMIRDIAARQNARLAARGDN